MIDAFLASFKALIALFSTVLRTLLDLNHAFSVVLKRVNTRAPLPSPSPTSSAWQATPHPFPPQPLPERVDVLVIGSGITGASFVKTLLESPAGRGLRVAMVDAREVCSGATGRNGGHIKTAGYEEYAVLRKRLGAAVAANIVRFRASHLQQLINVAADLGRDAVLHSEVREVETLDIFHDFEVFEKASKRLQVFKEELPTEGSKYRCYEGGAARVKSLSPQAVGVIAYPAVEYMDFSLHPGTAVISFCPSPASHETVVTTSTGATIIAKHIVHATNAYASHLLPGMTGKVFPVRGTMSSQPPGRDFPNLSMERSWSFIWKKGYDYLTQRPDGTMMFGGGLLNGEDDGFADIGVPHDDATSIFSAAHLRGLLPTVFGRHWGSCEVDGDVSVWTGAMGWSADMLPWVGEVGADVTGRGDGAREWVSVGYSGEGMVNAWLCGAGLAKMLVGEANEIPGPMKVSSKRLKRARVEDYVEDYF